MVRRAVMLAKKWMGVLMFVGALGTFGIVVGATPVYADGGHCCQVTCGGGDTCSVGNQCTACQCECNWLGKAKCKCVDVE